MSASSEPKETFGSKSNERYPPGWKVSDWLETRTSQDPAYWEYRERYLRKLKEEALKQK